MSARTVTPASPERQGRPGRPPRAVPTRTPRHVRDRQSGARPPTASGWPTSSFLTAVTVVALAVVSDGPLSDGARCPGRCRSSPPRSSPGACCARSGCTASGGASGRRPRRRCRRSSSSPGRSPASLIAARRRPRGRPQRRRCAWAMPTLAGLLVLHAVWWIIVRRWRREGRLTPNIVIVGATRHAEQIVGDALAERDVNVLGVFDDRLARSPAATSPGCRCSVTSPRCSPTASRRTSTSSSSPSIPTARARVQEVMERLAVAAERGRARRRRRRRRAATRRSPARRRAAVAARRRGRSRPPGVRQAHCRTSCCPASAARPAGAGPRR